MRNVPLSAAEAARQTGVPKRTVQAAIARGDLKAEKLSGLTGAYLIRQRDLDAWVAKRQAAARAADERVTAALAELEASLPETSGVMAPERHGPVEEAGPCRVIPINR